MDTFESKRMLPFFKNWFGLPGYKKFATKKDAGYGFWFKIENNFHVVVVGRESPFQSSCSPLQILW